MGIIRKYNPYHDGKGRFTTANGAGIGMGAKGIQEGSPAVKEAVASLPHYRHSVPNDSNIDQADAYERMVSDPSDPRVKASYDALEETLMKQYHHLEAHGFSYEPQGEHPGYTGVGEVIDALNHKHLRVYLTEGGGDLAPDHPMMKPVEGVHDLGPNPVLNDVFRAVHDTIGHGVSGGQFGVSGERAAWIAHRETFPDAALPALWNETRGQAAWTNAGPHMQATDITGRKYTLSKGEPGYLPLPARPFAEQKAGWSPGAGAKV